MNRGIIALYLKAKVVANMETPNVVSGNLTRNKCTWVIQFPVCVSIAGANYDARSSANLLLKFLTDG